MFAADEKIDTIDDRYWQVRAEPVPQEEMDPPQSTRRIHAYHVNPDATNNVRLALLLCGILCWLTCTIAPDRRAPE